jgi:hypothetical protein
MELSRDGNDEDAFGKSGKIVSVRIGRKWHSRAGYYLQGQQEIDILLELLISLRQSNARMKVGIAPRRISKYSVDR